MAGGYTHQPIGTEAIVKALTGQREAAKSAGDRSVLRPFTVGATEYQGLYVPTADGGMLLVVGYEPDGSAKLLDCNATIVDIDGSTSVTIHSSAGNASVIAAAVLTLTGASISIQGPTTFTSSVQINGVLSVDGNIGTDADLIVGDDLTVTDDAVIGDSLRVNGNVGFYNTAPQSKPTVSGSRGGNAALASLLTALANLGLITNSTS